MKIEADKWKHFWVGIVMGAILQGFMEFLLRDHLMAATGITFFIVVLICYGFELFSKITGLGTYDIIDALAGVIGGAIGMAAVFLIL